MPHSVPGDLPPASIASARYATVPAIVTLANPLGICFFQDLYTGLFPKDRIDNMKL